MALNYHASLSPMLLLPPQPSYFDTLTHAPHPSSVFASHSPSASTNNRPRKLLRPSLNHHAASSSLAGRKRSLDDIADEPADLLADGSTLAPRQPKPEPIYGPGMTLIYPGEPGYSISAESQAGTWVDEELEKAEKVRKAAASRTRIASRKSQRKSATESGPSTLNSLSASASTSTSGAFDQAQYYLGVSWRDMSLDSNKRIMAKAYAPIVNSDFPFSGAQLLLHNEALGVFLVRATSQLFGGEQFLLLKDDMTTASVVASGQEQMLQNLRALPPVIEGPHYTRKAMIPHHPDMPAFADADAMEM